MARNDIEAEINNSLNREIKLHGKIELNVNKSGSFTSVSEAITYAWNEQSLFLVMP